MLIRELAVDERPRDRLLMHGSETLSDAELLSILLRSGRPGASAIELARELLARTKGLKALVGAEPQALLQPGLGPGKLTVILAAVELGRRLIRSEIPDSEPLSRPEVVAQYLALRYTTDAQEVMGSLFLDTRNRLLSEGEIFRGTLSRAAVEPRAILKRGLLLSASGLVLFHTHPSGDPAPSAEDLAFTRRLSEAGEVVGIRLVDHLVLGSAARWVSLRQRGGW